MNTDDIYIPGKGVKRASSANSNADPVPNSQPMDNPEDMEVEPEGEDIDSGEEGDDQPDLQEYFSQWDVPLEDQISMCRAYASYLVSLLRAQDPDNKQKRYR